MDMQYILQKKEELSTPKAKSSPRRLAELDFLSVLFCLMILYVHTSSYVIDGFEPTSFGYQVVYACWKISMSAIYGFVFVSAIKFTFGMKEKFSLIKYYISRFKKILIPYFAATLVYYLYFCVANENPFDLKALFRYIINGQASAQLYFVNMIVVFYLLAPLWRLLIKRVNPIFPLAISVCLCVVMILAFPELTYQNNIFFKCLPFWILGCYFGQVRRKEGIAAYRCLFPLKKKETFLVFFFATALYAGYACVTHASGTPLSGLFGFLYAIVFVYFVSHMATDLLATRNSKSLAKLSDNTYYVFLDHCLFVVLANAFLPQSGFAYYILRLLIVPVISFVVAYLLRGFGTYVILRGFGIKKILKFFLQRVVIISLLILVQIAFLFAITVVFYEYYVYFYLVISIVNILVSIYIINSNSNPSYQLAWITVVLGMPPFGLLLYLVFHGGTLTSATKNKMLAITDGVKQYLTDGQACLDAIGRENRDAMNQSRYIQSYASCPPYDNSSCVYFSSGEEMFATLFRELRKAKRYIFLEFFIIKPGYIFDRLHEILVQKAKEGVDVRILYDDFGCIRHISSKLVRMLQSENIKVKSFNPYMPVLSAVLNNRDHRKIVSIDGITSFTGGANIADEYANLESPFGHWKDSAIMIKGEASWSFTVMFLSNWNYLSAKRKKGMILCEEYKPDYTLCLGENGYIQPYTDSPLDSENVSEAVYLNMINRAQKYVYISSPYLALGSEIITAICNAAKSGVDVRIVVPGIPDKKAVNQVTKSYYEIFTTAGVKIYEYVPGFNHAKLIICDDLFATVGSVNLDFRSLYLSFECGVWLFRSPEIPRILADYREMLRNSQEITQEMAKKTNLFVRVARGVLRFFSPLM